MGGVCGGESARREHAGVVWGCAFPRALTVHAGQSKYMRACKVVLSRAPTARVGGRALYASGRVGSCRWPHANGLDLGGVGVQQ